MRVRLGLGFLLEGGLGCVELGWVSGLHGG